MLASGLPHNPTCRLGALSIPGLLDASGLSTDEELVATELVRFITVGLNFATILFSTDCSCILFAILSVMQLSKPILLAQQRDLKWLMLNKRRLFHSSRVKCPLVNMSAITSLLFLTFVSCYAVFSPMFPIISPLLPSHLFPRADEVEFYKALLLAPDFPTFYEHFSLYA